MRLRCRSRRGTTLVAPFVDTATDAIAILETSASCRPGGLFMLCLDDDRRLLGVVEVTEASPDATADICATLLPGSGGDDQMAMWSAVVLTDLPAGSELATVGAELDPTWFDLKDRFIEAGVELLDWLLVAGDQWWSMTANGDCGEVWWP